MKYEDIDPAKLDKAQGIYKQWDLLDDEEIKAVAKRWGLKRNGRSWREAVIARDGIYDLY